jgi:hypothetical protein
MNHSALNLLIFVHVPKAGGSTLRSIMQRNVLPEERLADDHSNAALNAHQLRLFSGHVRFGLHHGLARPVKYVTMMREPLDRYVSDYFFAFQKDDHRLRNEIVSGNVDLEQLVTNGRYHDRLALIRQTTGLERPAAENPELAAEILEASYTFVGLMERFDESVLLLAHVLGWSPPLYIQRNRTSMPPEMKRQRDAFQQNPHPVALDRFATDTVYYRAAEAFLERSIALAGPSFPTALAAFRSMQAEISEYCKTASSNDLYTQAEFALDDPLPAELRNLIWSEEWHTVNTFIHSDTPLRRRTPPLLHGCIEHLRDGYVSGWVVRYGSGEPIRLVVTCRDSQAIEIVADIQRPDLVGRGFNPTPLGFRCELPSSVNYADVKILIDEVQPLTSPILMEMLQD